MEPDVIFISDDDDEPITPATGGPIATSPLKVVCAEISPQALRSPRTPGRLSLSYGKTKRVELKNSDDFVTITPVIKKEINSPKNVLPAVRTKDSLTISTVSPQMSKEDNLQALIEKFRKKNEAIQPKAKANLMLPVPVSGPLEPYQCPENVNEVHSSTESEEMKNNAITRMFDTCRGFSTDKDDLIIIEKMWAKVKKCDPMYTTSSKFLDFTQSVHAKILLEPTNMHLYLKEFYDELSRLPSSKSKNAQPSSRSKSHSLNAEAVPSTSRSPSEGREPDTTSTESGNEKHVQKLEKLLEKCSKKVKKLEAKEMSMDDLDDDGSIYLLIDRFKRKSLQIWKKLCELNGEKKAQCGRVTEKKFVYEGSRFPEINKCVSRLVNRSKSFPDFCDITDLITQCNGQYDLHLRPFQIDTLAREAFKDIGKELKRRRILDYEEHFGCPALNAEEVDNDPASQDAELNAKLAESSELGMKKANELFESFVMKQAELDQLPPNPEGSGSQNDDESEGEGTEKEVPIDVAQLAAIESESESESKEEDVENDIEEAEEAETDIEEEVEYEIDIEEHVNEITENHIMSETDLEMIEEDSVIKCEVVMDTLPLDGASPVGEHSLLNQYTTKRSLTPELLIQPPSKRPTTSDGKDVQVRILHDLEDFPKPNGPDLNNGDSTDSEIFIIE